MPNSTGVTLRQLRYFARAVELGSISRAAHDLHVAQTALGLQVRALEDALGVSLMLRHPKGVIPTEDGRIVYDRSHGIIGAVDSLITEVRERIRNRPHDIWLGLAPNVISAIGTCALVEQEKRIPGFRLHLVEGTRKELLDSVETGELDWAILHEAADVAGCRSVPILRQSVLLVSRPGSGLRPNEVTLRDALSQDLVLDSGKRVISGVLDRAAKRLGLAPKIVYEIDSVSAIKQMILSQGVSGLLGQALVRDEIDSGLLEGRRIVEPDFTVTAYFVTRSDHAPTERELPVLKFLDGLLLKYCAAYPDFETRLGSLTSVLEEDLEAGSVG